MTRIEAFVLVTTSFLLFLSILGSRRRQTKNFFIQKAVFLTYTLSSSLISYTFGSMQSSAVKSSMYPIWAVSLYLLLTTSVDSTAYSLTDHTQTNKLFLRAFLDLIYAVLLSSSISSHVGYLLVSAMFNLVSMRFIHRLCASIMAAESWNMNKIISDYMEEEHKHGQADYDPCTMDGYRYLVDWPLQEIKLEEGISYRAAALLAKNNATQVVDVEKVWRKFDDINGRSPSSNEKFHMELRDACLSFSLFHLLRRCAFGYACSESSQQKTHDFVFKGLLLDDDRSRVFKVIEVELAFMYDFFTKYAYMYNASRAALYWSLVTASLMFVTAYLTATSATWTFSSLDVSFLDSSSTIMIDKVITVLILTSIIVFEVLQQLLFWTSIWGRVSLVCQYVREEASSTRGRYGRWWVKLKEVLARIGVQVLNQHYWRGKLDQYSLLESVRYNPFPDARGFIAPKVKYCLRKYLSADLGPMCPAAFDDPVGHRRGWIVRKPGESNKLPEEVKNALVQCLQRTQGDLTNGKSALVFNGADNLLWFLRTHEKSVSLKTENQTINILTWHIATCYCEMAQSLAYLGSGVGSDFVAATKLSKYCAYLVVSAPKLLPGHHFDTKLVFDEVAAEASDFLGHARDKYECMRRSPHEARGTFHRGVKLGKQLEKMQDCARWKVLADFWSEMLLYLAPSDKVTEHIECLAKGGEFIIHLWALLTHAGILERDQTDIENASRFRRANSYPLTRAGKLGNYVRSAEMKVQKGENNLVQNVQGTPNAGIAPSDVEEVE